MKAPEAVGLLDTAGGGGRLAGGLGGELLARGLPIIMLKSLSVLQVNFRTFVIKPLMQ